MHLLRPEEFASPSIQREHECKFLDSNPTRNCRTSTPKSNKRASTRAKFFSSMKKSSRNKPNRTLTPPRNLAIGLSTSIKHSKRRSSMNYLTMSPQLDTTKYQIRSSELDPSPFQVDIPPFEELLAHAKICLVIDNYTEVGGKHFDFTTLMPWKAKDRHMSHTDEDSRDESFIATPSPFDSPIYLALKDSIHDIVVEGFFREYFEDKTSESGLGRIEAVVFSSENRRQFIVSYRGSSDVQCRPVHANSSKMIENYSLQQSFKILNDHVYSLLYRLSILKPFCDVIMVGHSFGAVLSILSGELIAREKPMLRISCHVYGSPRVGDDKFRRAAHSLPNLKIIRVERRQDPFVSLPEGAGWSHVGHAIVLHCPTSTFQSNEDELLVNAYRFDAHRPSYNFVQLMKESMCSISALGRQKAGNEILSYVKDLELFQDKLSSWVVEYEGEAGTGIYGSDNEVRLLA